MWPPARAAGSLPLGGARRAPPAAAARTHAAGRRRAGGARRHGGLAAGAPPAAAGARGGLQVRGWARAQAGAQPAGAGLAVDAPASPPAFEEILHHHAVPPRRYYAQGAMGWPSITRFDSSGRDLRAWLAWPAFAWWLALHTFVDYPLRWGCWRGWPGCMRWRLCPAPGAGCIAQQRRRLLAAAPQVAEQGLAGRPRGARGGQQPGVRRAAGQGAVGGVGAPSHSGAAAAAAALQARPASVLEPAQLHARALRRVRVQCLMPVAHAAGAR